MRSLPRLACLAILAALAAPSAGAAEGARRPMAIDDLWSFEQVGRPVLSPDGGLAVFPVAVPSLDRNESNSDLWIVPTDGGGPPRRLTWNEGPDGSPAWSPDGRRIAFVSKRKEENAQLYVLSLDGGEAERITDLPTAVADPRWHPDGKRILFVASTWPDVNDDFDALRKRQQERDVDKVRAQITENRALRYWDHYLADGRVSHVFEASLETGKVRDLMPGSSRILGLDGAEWDLSPDGSEIAFSANATDPPYRTWNQDVFVVPVAGGEPRNLSADNPADDLRPRYSPDGRFLLWGRNRRVELDADFTRLALHDRRTGATSDLAAEWDGSPSGWTFTPDGRTVVFHGEERGRVHLYAVPAAGGAPRVVVRGGSTGGACAGPDGLVLFTLQSLTRPPEIAAVRLADGEIRNLTAFNDAKLLALDLGRVEDVTFAGANGDPVQMFVVLPPGFDPARKWPLVHLIHGGPHGAWTDSFHFRWNAALMASRGYVTVLVNFHGSTGFGQAFAESIVGAHGDKPFTDIMRATDRLIAAGYVDETRMAAAGGSYGGYLVAWILGHTGRFAALVDHAGVYDLMAQFASDATWGRSTNYGAAPWEDPGTIDRWSPSRYAASFRTPTLVLHGEKDFRVPVTQGINLHGVLTAKGVPSRIVIFPEEGHGVVKPQGSRLWWTEVFAWLERWLK
mgnify:CR=1 FL=1